MGTTIIKSGDSDYQAIVDATGALKTTGSSTVTGTVDADINGLTNFQTSQYTIGVVAVQLTPTPLANRSSIMIKAVISGSNAIYIGNSSSVTVAGGGSPGFPLYNGDAIQLDLTPAHVIYAISPDVSQSLFVLELGN